MPATGLTEDHVVISAATYNRPDGLATLLDHVEKLTFSNGEPRVSVVIVDNSVDGNAREFVEERAQGYRFELVYSHQTQRGISPARNRGLELALEFGADWIAFIDDDEFPDERWLDGMLATVWHNKADAAIGTLLPDFLSPPATWLERGRFLAIDAYSEGQPLDFGNTSNSIVRLDRVRKLDLRFDNDFALSGGEDTLFFEYILRDGGTVVFSRQGVAHETIAPERMELRWHLMRWTRSGNTNARILLLLEPGLKTRLLKVFFGGMVRLGAGGLRAIVTAPVALFGAGHIPAEGLRVACRGVGFITTAFGTVMEEYRTVTR